MQCALPWDSRCYQKITAHNSPATNLCNFLWCTLLNAYKAVRWVTRKRRLPPPGSRPCSSQGFTAMTDELPPGWKKSFVLKCTKPEQEGRKKKQRTALSPEQSPLTSIKETYTIGLAEVHPADRGGEASAQQLWEGSRCPELISIRASRCGWAPGEAVQDNVAVSALRVLACCCSCRSRKSVRKQAEAWTDGRNSVAKGCELSLLLGRSKLCSSGKKAGVLGGFALKLGLGGRSVTFICIWPD